MMSTKSMYSSEDKVEFWTKLKEFIDSQNGDYVDLSATNRICIKNISFIQITTDEMNNHLLLIRDRYRDELRFENCEFLDADLNCVHAKTFFMSCQFKGENKFSFSKEINIKSCNFDGNNIFEVKHGIAVNVSDTVFLGDVSFDGLHLKSSNDSKSSWFNVDFSGSILSITKSNIYKDASFKYIKWPSYSNFCSDREIFRQFKVCMDESKNTIDEVYFHSLEMDSYCKELIEQGWTWHNWQDKCAFYAVKYTSNFSQSWALPLLWIIVVSVVSYSYVCGVTALIDCGLDSFFHFINPFNRASEHYMTEYSVWFLHKLLMVFFSYHLVVSLRRKTKF